MPKQGDIYLADLNPVKGHEQAGLRPVLVMQNNVLNTNLSTVIIAPLTTNPKAKGKLTTFHIPAKKHGVERESIVLLYQIRTLDKGRLMRKVGELNNEQFSEVKKQLHFVF
jgi:mRNA interferase MazF